MTESDETCTCTHYVVDHSDPEPYHPENVDRELTPGCPVHDDEDEPCGCVVPHPRWCAWNGACCDRCTHDTTYEARHGG